MGKSILVTGANGQVGSEIQALSENYPYTFFFTDKTSLNISDKTAVENYIKKNNIDTIINCAAYTAVDNAQSDEKNCNLINHIAVKNLAQLSNNMNLSFVHISTDYVFDGEHCKPYVEDDITNPKTVYGITKLKGEEAILEISPQNSIIIRTAWVYSSFGNNFVKTMLKLAKIKEQLTIIFDQVGTPTYARDLAKTILEILPKITNEKPELFHYTNEGVLSWYDFAKEIMKMAGSACEISPIETKDYPTPAKRPYFSLLNKAKIKNRYKIEIPYWKDSLKECLVLLGEKK